MPRRCPASGGASSWTPSPSVGGSPSSAAVVRRWTFVVVVLAVLVADVSSTVYLNKWAVEIEGGPQVADVVAAQSGFRNLGQIGSLENFYLFEQRRLVRRSVISSRRHNDRLQHQPRVRWVEQQTVRRRVKRAVNRSEYLKWTWNDPLWSRMWYLNRGMRGGIDMNVVGAWELGYTGEGVVVTILDDGIEHNHTDLQQNYDPDASYDINGFDDDPMPRYDTSDDNRHGTRCAGQVAAIANNRKCTVGVAYKSRIGGIRMLDGDVSDSVEAQALSFNPQHIHIYSASWGPEDNGRVIEGPAKLAREAFIQGVLKGRGGLGSIYIWASGNGGSRSDSCSCDGYTNSIYTLSVSSTSEHGMRPWYLEECPSTLAATYSSGENYRERKILTTDLHNTCTEDHTGTSASAPLAAGMCALALEANPELTWRDMQYIVIMSARTEPLHDAYWVVNGVGRKVSHRYGYGLMDAKAMVQLAERWTTVPPQVTCTTEIVKLKQNIEKSGTSFEISTNGCADSDNEINFLEHVQAKVTLSYSRRGDLQLHLISPNGTRSTLLPRRKDDYQPGNLDAWPFLSVFYWGEHPNGTWTLEIENVGSELNAGVFEEWQLIFYGTKSSPVNLSDVPRQRTRKPSPTAASTLTTPGFQSPDVPSSNASSSSIPSNFSTAAPVLKTDDHVPHSSSTPNVSSTKNLTGKGSLNENATELKGVIRPNSTSDVLSPVVKPDASDVSENQTTRAYVAVTSVIDSNSSYSASTLSPLAVPKVIEHNTTRNGINCLSLNASSDCVENESLLNTSHSSDHITSFPVASTTIVSLSLDEVTVGAATSADLLQHTCHEQCSADGCSGESASDCIKCKHARLQNTRECVPDCPKMTYLHNSSGVCEPCPLLCLTCSTVAFLDEHILSCLSCIDGHYLVALGSIDACSERCPERHYADEITGQCVHCNDECLQCAGTATQCIQCADGYELLGTSCVPPCQMSEFRADDNSCEACDISCRECVGPHIGDCVECTADWWWENGICVSNCSEGYYGTVSDEDRVCHMCHPSCMTCFGPNEGDCISCYHPLKLIGSMCHESCTEGHYETDDEVCLPCHESCKTCRGPYLNDCITCHYSQFYLDGECVDSCPIGYFGSQTLMVQSVQDSYATASGDVSGQLMNYDFSNDIHSLSSPRESSSGSQLPENADTGQTIGSDSFVSSETGRWQQCERCHATCASCIGDLPTDCVKCHTQLVLSQGRCTLQCNRGEYLDNGYCMQCHANCLSCSGPTESECTDCHQDFYYHEGYCMEVCPRRYYPDREMCFPCVPSCAACIGYDNCTECIAPYVLSGHRCVTCCEPDQQPDEDCCLCNSDKDTCILSSMSTADFTTDDKNIPPSVTSLTMQESDIIDTTMADVLSVELMTSAPLYDGGSQTNQSSSTIMTDSVSFSLSSSSGTDASDSSSIHEDANLTPTATSVKSSQQVSVDHAFVTPTAFSATVRHPSPKATDGSAQDSTDMVAGTPVSSLPSTVTPVSSGAPPLWMTILAIALCAGALFALVIIISCCLCQARAHHKLCWAKHRCYLPVPLFYQNGTNPVAVDATAPAPVKIPELTPLTSV